MRIFLFFLVVWTSVAATPLAEHVLDEKAVYLGVGASAVWLRVPGQERWEIGERTEEESGFILDWAEKQGLLSEWAPSRRDYDAALILGATTVRMEMRLTFLKRLWEEGVRFGPAANF